MPIETETERQALFAIEGSFATNAAGQKFSVIFDKEGVVDLDIQGFTPSVQMSTNDFDAAGLALDQTITINTFAGKTYTGIIRTKQFQDDGEAVVLGLQI